MASTVVPDVQCSLRHLACVGRRLPARCRGIRASACLPAVSPVALGGAAASRPSFDPPRLGLCLGAAVAAGFLAQLQPKCPLGVQRPAACDGASSTCADGGLTADQGPASAEGRAARARLHVVLDVDETLVHTQQVHPSVVHWLAGFGRRQRDDVFGLLLPEGVAIQVSKRPGLDGFLSWLQKRGYEVSLYTAGTRKYVDAILPRLDPEGVIGQCLVREDCVPAPGLPNVYLKDLRRVLSVSTRPDGSEAREPADLARTVLVDNNPVSFAMQPENGILVRDWLGGTPGESPDDAEFERVKALLLKLEAGAPSRDVREVLPMFQSAEVRKLIAHLGSRLPFSAL